MSGRSMWLVGSKYFALLCEILKDSMNIKNKYKYSGSLPGLPPSLRPPSVPSFLQSICLSLLSLLLLSQYSLCTRFVNASYSVGCSFTWSVVSFAISKLFSLMSFHSFPYLYVNRIQYSLIVKLSQPPICYWGVVMGLAYS